MITVHDVIGTILAPSSEKIVPRQDHRARAKVLVVVVILNDILWSKPAYQTKASGNAVVAKL
jgi:hypothetical protein